MKHIDIFMFYAYRYLFMCLTEKNVHIWYSLPLTVGGITIIVHFMVLI